MGDGCNTSLPCCSAGKALEQTDRVFLCVGGQSCLYFWLSGGRAESGDGSGWCCPWVLPVSPFPRTSPVVQPHHVVGTEAFYVRKGQGESKHTRAI